MDAFPKASRAVWHWLYTPVSRIDVCWLDTSLVVVLVVVPSCASPRCQHWSFFLVTICFYLERPKHLLRLRCHPSACFCLLPIPYEYADCRLDAGLDLFKPGFLWFFAHFQVTLSSVAATNMIIFGVKFLIRGLLSKNRLQLIGFRYDVFVSDQSDAVSNAPQLTAAATTMRDGIVLEARSLETAAQVLW